MITEPEPGGEREAYERFLVGLRDQVLALQRCNEAVLAIYFTGIGTMVEMPPPDPAS